MTDKPTDIFGAIEITEGQQPPAKGKKTARKAVKPSRSGSKKKKPTRKKGTSSAKRLIWPGLVALLFALYIGAGYLLVPYLIQTVLPNSLKERSSLALSTGKVQFNPFSFKLDADDLSLSVTQERQQDERLLSIDYLKVDLDFLSLLRGELVCKSVDIKGLDLRITRNEDKTYNITNLLGDGSLQDRSDIIDFAELPFLFSINNIKVSKSRVIIYDRITQKDHLIDQIELALPVVSNFDYQNEFYIQPRFSAVVNGSPVTLKGDSAFGMTDQLNQQTQLSCDLNDIDIPLYFDYLPVALPIDITQGKANGKLQFTFTPEQETGDKVRVEFSLAASSLTLESRDGRVSLSVPEAHLEGTLEPFSNTIVLENVLLREPLITSEREMTRDTLASLAPLTLRPGPNEGLHQVIPSLSVKLLIAEGGRYGVKSSGEKMDMSWKSLQLSIKNFSNEQTGSGEIARSFRLSGEQQSSGAFFTWQGEFDKENQPVGNLQLNNIPVARIAPFLGRKSSDVSGTAEVNGLLSMVLSDKPDRPLDYSLKSTRLTIKELQVKDEGTVWLRTPFLRCEPLSRVGGVTDLGNVFLSNSTAVINREKLPYLFQAFSKQSDNQILHGIDFSGSLKVVESGAEKTLLDFKNVVFQANKLEQQELQQDNFVFSAQLREAEDFLAKGSLHIAPLQLTSRISANTLSPLQLFSWFSESRTLLTSQGVISLKGTFQYPQQEFSGEMKIRNLLIGDPAQPVFEAENLNLADVIWSKTNQNLNIKDLIVDQPQFTWHQEQSDPHPITLASLFLRHIFLPEPDDTATDPDISLSRFAMVIDQIGITDGSLSYRDERLVPPVELGLTGIKGTLSNLRYPVAKEGSTITLTGNIEGNPFTVEATGNLMQSPPSARTSFSAAALPLNLFTRQIERRIPGIDTADATANVSQTAVWNTSDSRIDATLVINGLAPARPGTAAALSLAVLLGSDGSIRTEFQTDNSRAAKPFLGEALDHFARLLIKGSLNPMLLAGPDFKDLVEEPYITFDPGTTLMTPESIERLNRYGEFLATHPLVTLTVTGFSDQSLDAPMLKTELAAMEKKRVDEDNRKRAQEYQKQQEAARKQKEKDAGATTIQESDLPTKAPFVPATPRMVIVTDKMLDQLALKRQQTVINHLVGSLSLPADRIDSGSPDDSRIKDDGNFARVGLTLGDDFRKTGEQAGN